MVNGGMNTGTLGDDDIRAELDYLKVVTDVLTDRINKSGAAGAVNRAEVMENRRLVMEETRVLRDFKDVAALASADMSAAESERKYRAGELVLGNMKKMLSSPYFGRIDFTEAGYSDTENIYIGLCSLCDEKLLSYYIYDWRAPVSSMYYEYSVGKADYPVNDLNITGEIKRKRQYKITDGEVRYMFDSDVTVNDEILMGELSRPSAATARPVISSIQREQNRAIRRDRSDNLVIFGLAGSGKTVVGLHRLAYLLYKYRGLITSANMRIVTNSNVFRSYISGIIPELGEETIPMPDFGDLFAKGLGKIKVSDAYEQIEALPAGKNDRAKAIRIKYSNDFLDFIVKLIKTYRPNFSDITLCGQTICAGKELARLYEDRTAAGTLDRKTERLLIYLNVKLDEFFKENERNILLMLVERAGGPILEGDHKLFYERFKVKNAERVAAAANPDARRLYDSIIRRWNKTGPAVQWNAEDRSRPLNIEDALMLLYISLLKGGSAAAEPAVRHVLVDEAQDMCRLMHRILRLVYPNARFTVLADVNQALYPDINVTEKDELIRLYSDEVGAAPAKIELGKSYRQTFEISRFAAGIMGSFDEDRYYHRHGDEPARISTGGDVNKSIIEILETVREKGFGSVGILTETRGQAAEIHGSLVKVGAGDIYLIDGPGASFRPGVAVMPVVFAKGLEFDAVIIPGYARLTAADKKRILYLMCTRALHMLYLLD